MCGLTDEDKLGFTYDELQKVAEGKAEDVAPEQVEKIRAKINPVCWKKELLNIPSFKYR